MAYCTVNEVKARIDKTYTDDDSLITALIAAAEKTINEWTNHPDGFEALSVATARRFVGSGKTYQLIDENVEISSVEVKDSATDTTYETWASGDYISCRGAFQHPTFDRTPNDLLIVDITGDKSHFTDGNVGGMYPYSDWNGYSYNDGYYIDSRRSRKHLVPGQPTVRVTAKWGYSVTVPTPIREACAMQTARWYKKYQGAMADALASTEFGQLLFIQVLDPDIKAILWLGRFVKPATGRA
jgi:hypothetical protein